MIHKTVVLYIGFFVPCRHLKWTVSSNDDDDDQRKKRRKTSDDAINNFNVLFIKIDKKIQFLVQEKVN